MSEDVIKNLRDLQTKFERELSEISQKIRILDTVPKAKALVGKCFKYKNSYTYSGGKRGVIYKRVIGVVGENVLVDWFEIGGFNHINITFNDTEYISYFNNTALIPITRKQYLKIYKQVLRNLATRAKK